MTDAKRVPSTVLIEPDLSEEDLEKLDERWIDNAFRMDPDVTRDFMAFHFRVPESVIEKFCLKKYGKNFNDAKRLLFQYTRQMIIKKQLQFIMEGSQPMAIHWGRVYCGQDNENKSLEREVKPIPLAYIPKSQRNK